MKNISLPFNWLIAYSCCGFLSDLFFVGLNPFIQISFIKSPAFIQANLAEPVADNFLFEAVARKAAVFGRFVEVENPFPGSGAGEGFPQMIRYRSCESGKVDEI